VRKLIIENPLAAGVTTHIGGQSEELDAIGEVADLRVDAGHLLVYLVMASQFESLLHPFVIMFSIPLALVGAVLALKITFTPLSVVVFIGLIMLAGIVVKNAIVLIDRVNQLREEGVEKIAAIMQAAESRLRPISMTTLCTLLGFMPLAITWGDGNEVRSPMAIAGDRRPARFDAVDAGRDSRSSTRCSIAAVTRSIAHAASASVKPSPTMSHL